MNITLGKAIAAASKRGIFTANERYLRTIFDAFGILRSIDESSQIPSIEILKPMYFIHDFDTRAQLRPNLRGKLEVEIVSFGENMHEHISPSARSTAPIGFDRNKRK